MPDIYSQTATWEEPTRPVNLRVALCLSGGGFRAALFHLGAARRLNELGVLSRVDTVSSASGGSILSAHLATQLRPWPALGTSFQDWESKVAVPFRAFARRNIRTRAILRRLLPWNWFRAGAQVEALEVNYQNRLSQLNLQDLPERPNFVFCATDVTYGVSWVFSRKRIGSYLAGYLKPNPTWPLAKAVAASSCFPPFFGPMPIPIAPGHTLVDGLDREKKDSLPVDVTDGGLYDNLGLEPVDGHGIVLVSDGGAPFVPAVSKGLIARIRAYVEISLNQAERVRKRWLVSQFRNHERQGAYWGIRSAVVRYQPDAPLGYSKALALEVLARIRTDLDAFSEAEIAVLENHGYLLADSAMAAHLPQLLLKKVPIQPPHPEWLDEDKVRVALRDSHRVHLLGRR